MLLITFEFTLHNKLIVVQKNERSKQKQKQAKQNKGKKQNKKRICEFWKLD